MSYLRTAIVCLSLLATTAFGQAPDTLWTRTYGGALEDYASSIVELADGGFVLVGATSSFGAGEYDAILVKFNAVGDTVWSRTYGGPGYDHATSVCKSQDGGFFLAGRTSASPGNEDIYVVKTDSNADSVWTRSIGGVNNGGANAIIQASDGTVICVGVTNDALSTHVVATRLSAEGEVLWVRTYGNDGNSFATSVVESDDSSFLIAGATWPNGADTWDDYVVKINAMGDTLWTRRYENPDHENIYAITGVAGGGFLAVGNATRMLNGYNDIHLRRMSEHGETLWERHFGDEHHDEARSVCRTSDGGFVIGGVTFVDDQSANAIALRLNSEGDTLWTKTFDFNEYDYFMSVVETADFGYALGGMTAVQEISMLRYNILLVRLETDSNNFGIRVVSPNGSDTTQIMGFDTVTWLSNSVSGGVSIELNRQYPIGAWETITDSTENDGEYEWFVTDPLSDSCRIRICALQDTFCDISDGNFSIVSSQGYLGLARSSAPNSPVLSWSAVGTECPSGATQTFRIKNFGSEPIVVFQPQEPVSPQFSRTTTCGSFFALAPGGISACSLTVSFAPIGEGLFLDTLRIQTDAVNGVNGIVNIPLSGSQIRTPESPEVVISTAGNNAVLRWSPIVESIGHCQIDAPSYLVFFAENNAGPFWFHGVTADTAYTHLGAVQYASAMFYHVHAVNGDPGMLASLPRGSSDNRVLEADIMKHLCKEAR